MKSVTDWFARSKKAVIAFLIPVIAEAYVIADSKSASITSHEWIGLVAAVAAGLGVYGVTNRK
jgi:hypothetical protein